jgi:hypothetical protein
MSSTKFYLRFWLAALMAVTLNVSCKSIPKSAKAKADCGKEIVGTPTAPCQRRGDSSPRYSESKQRISATLAATEKLKNQSPERMAPAVEKLAASDADRESVPQPEPVQLAAQPKIEMSVIPQPEVIPEVPMVLEKKPVVKLAALDKVAEIEKKTALKEEAVEPIPVVEKKTVEKLVAVEKPIEKSSADKNNIAIPILVEGDNTSRIIMADEREVEVRGNNCVIVICGGCARLKLAGEKNQIQCDSVSQVNIAGDLNTLVLGVMGRGVITGNRNIISWGEGMGGSSPIAETTGQGNEIGRLE